MKVERGCECESPIPGKWKIGEYSFQRCPKKQVDRSAFEYMRAYRRYAIGYLPNSGGWLEQPAKFNDIIDIIEAEIGDIQKNREEELAKLRRKK